MIKFYPWGQGTGRYYGGSGYHIMTPMKPENGTGNGMGAMMGAGFLVGHSEGGFGNGNGFENALSQDKLKSYPYELIIYLKIS